MERIDVHCHAVPLRYRQHAIENGHENPDGMPSLPPWSAEQHMAVMKTLNISKSILSITSPGTHLQPSEDEYAATLTRQTNEELSAICVDHPDFFKFFASLPLPAVEASLEEIDHALDNLGAAGFAVLSNAHGVYLGDSALDPVFEKLNARKAIVFIHPTTCQYLTGSHVQAAKPLPQYPRPMLEFMFDETRAVANLLLSGTVSRYRSITFIMSHCGCALPSLLDRIGAFAMLTGAGRDRSEEFRTLLRERFVFDLAGFPFPDQIQGLLRTLGKDGEQQLVFGTDYPFTPEKVVVELSKRMNVGCAELFDGASRVYAGNAKRLFGI